MFTEDEVICVNGRNYVDVEELFEDLGAYIGECWNYTDYVGEAEGKEVEATIDVIEYIRNDAVRNLARKAFLKSYNESRWSKGDG